MLALEERFMIREMYRKGVSISEIARRTGRDRKTIRQSVTVLRSQQFLALTPYKHAEGAVRAGNDQAFSIQCCTITSRQPVSS